MTTAELNEVARFWTEFRSDSPEAQVIAGLQSALRESQAQTVQMREAAAKVADEAAKQSRYWANEHSVGRQSWLDTAQAEEEIARDIRRLPAPAARTHEDARREGVQAAFDAVHRISALPYMDSPRSAFDAARIMREACQDAIAALLSPAPAVAPVAAPRPLHPADCAHDSTPEVSVPHMPDSCGFVSDTNHVACPLPFGHAGWHQTPPVAAPKPGPTPDDDVLTARFRAVHERLDAVEMYLRPLGFAGRGAR